MGMLLPIVSTTIGPLYAYENNQAFAVIDGHEHSPGNGVPVPTAGISINADLPINSFNLSFIRSSRYASQVSPLALAADIRSVYVVGGDLYYNNGIGQQIQITAGAALNATTIGGIGGDYATSSASLFYTSFTSTFTFWSAVNIPAASDMGPLTIRTISLSPFGITINSPPALSADYSLTLPSSLPASTKILTLDNAGNIAAVYDTDNSTLEVSSNTLQVKAGGITTTQVGTNAIITSDSNVATGANINGSKLLDGSISVSKLFSPMSTGITVGLDGIAISNDISISTSATSYAGSGNAATITTSGRPVMVMMVPTSGGAGTILANTTFNFGSAVIGIRNNSTYIAEYIAGPFTINSNIEFPGNLCFIDTSVIGLPGTYAYTIDIKATTTGMTVALSSVSIMVYEI